MEQLLDNTDYMADFKPLTETELKIVRTAADMIREKIAIPCTGCSYCTGACPMGIDIPSFFSLYNADMRGEEGAREEYAERAVKYGCKKLQLFKGYFNADMVKRAHEHGIICNVFWSDDEKETEEFLDMGIDVILTNDYNRIARVVAKREKYITY